MKANELVQDPQVRTAVLKLFQANQAFGRAYADWLEGADDGADAGRRVGEAERSLDLARMELVQAQRRALDPRP